MILLPHSIYFLSVAEVKEIHLDQISRYGGAEGIRDEALLSSAVAQPCAMFNDQYLHQSIADMAAAYLYHLVMNHPFLDGNKRVGTASALVFLELNGLELDPTLDELQPSGQTKLEAYVVGLIAKEVSKDSLSRLFREHTLSLSAE